MDILSIFIGLVIGFVGAALFFVLRNQGVSKETTEKLNESEKQNSILSAALEEKKAQVISSLADLTVERNSVLSLKTTMASLDTTNKNLQEKLETNQKQVEDLHIRFTKEFENLSNRLLEENSKKFTEQNKTNIELVLNPLRDRIKDFEQKVDTSYKQEAMERNSLKGEIKNLVELNTKISLEANNLARALKGDTKMQGNWGEMILERILERSGLEKGSEYEVQLSSTTDEGRRLQPDVTIFLPENKHIIIDSKVSLVAYEIMVNSENEIEREKSLRDHITSVKNHVRMLSEKNYQHLPGMNSPDFVLLFMPIESSFGFAVQADQELFSYAWDRKIVIVSPSTLLATLRTISSIWKQEKQTKNAIEIASLAGSMYDKFVGFHGDLVDVGTKLDSARRSHDEALKKLSDGTGNIIRKVDQLKKLGAKTTKELPSSVVENSTEG